MFPRRGQIDPETARAIEQRLTDLLHEPATSSVRGEHDGDRGLERPRRAAADLPETEFSLATDGPKRAWIGALRSLVLSRAHLGVVAVLAVLSLLVAGWLVLRSRPVAIATPSAVTTPSPAAPTLTPSPTAARASPAAAPDVVVHVLGAVRRPGLVDLRPGSRVEDALEAAGGLRRDADPDRLNLAALVVDGEQIFVGTKAKPGGDVRPGSGGSSGDASTSGAGSSGAGSAGGQAVDLNAASQAQLEELPGVGPVTASKIISWRAEHGRFSRVEELQEVSGIGPKTYAEIAPHCRV